MFGYHFNLKAGHDSASPWWSWPLMLKPTWFLGDSFDNDMIAVIYNGGNPILFWAGIPALAACAVLAWKRRSMALVLVVAAFAFQYVPWIRIERGTFAYHYLTAVLFAMIAVAYCVDELLRRPAWRDLAIGYLVLVVVVGLLIYPLGSALPMPDWYINAARALPPWNFGFQFPDPPQGERAELIAVGGAESRPRAGRGGGRRAVRRVRPRVVGATPPARRAASGVGAGERASGLSALPAAGGADEDQDADPDDHDRPDQFQLKSGRYSRTRNQAPMATRPSPTHSPGVAAAGPLDRLRRPGRRRARPRWRASGAAASFGCLGHHDPAHDVGEEGRAAGERHEDRPRDAHERRIGVQVVGQAGGDAAQDRYRCEIGTAADS